MGFMDKQLLFCAQICNPLDACSLTVSRTLNYEVDAWGRVRNAVKVSDNLAHASLMDMAAISLSLQSELTSNYFKMRFAEKTIRLLHEMMVVDKKLLSQAHFLHQGGSAAYALELQARAQLEDAKTRLADMQLVRATYKHSIAVLVGAMPTNVHIRLRNRTIQHVKIAANIPSTLLLRRPDILAAANRVRAAHAAIGVAAAAFFPVLNLSALVGQQSSFLSDLATKPSNIWSLGPSSGVLTFTQPGITQTIFDGFKLQAQLANAKSRDRQMVSIYRQTVLKAFQEVEDALVSLHRINEEYRSQRASTHALECLLKQAILLHDGGAEPLMTVLRAKNNAMQSQLDLLALDMRQQLAGIALIKALGGGFSDIRHHRIVT
jgi:NodT family efflux transporter outer membrane factor (OMF) lipoprotein